MNEQLYPVVYHPYTYNCPTFDVQMRSSAPKEKGAVVELVTHSGVNSVKTGEFKVVWNKWDEETKLYIIGLVRNCCE